MRPEPDLIPGDDRAFLYGDGLFETLLCIDGKLLWPELHLDRLLEGASRLGIPATREQLRERLTASEPSCAAAILRLTLSRGSGPRGYRPPESATPRIRIASQSLDANPLAQTPVVTLAVARMHLSEQPALAGIKHCNRLEQVLAAREASLRNVDDVLMCTAAGLAQCSSCANVFAVQGRVLVTPSCERCGVSGTRRRLLLETLIPSLGLTAEVRPLTVDELTASDALLLSNSVRGIRAVARLDDCSYPASPIIGALQKAYREAAAQCIEG